MSQRDVLRTIDTVAEDIVYCPKCSATGYLSFRDDGDDWVACCFYCGAGFRVGQEAK